MRISAITESREGERRVALTPEAAQKLVSDGHTVTIESGAGAAIGALDNDYRDAGALIADNRAGAIAAADLVASINHSHVDDLPGLNKRHTLVALLDPLWRPEPMTAIAATGATALSLELVPRITRAQSMDVLSSMATVAGYQAVLTAAQQLPRMFPLLMTAAGTVAAARVVILGAGVAGLQAIATARRLGAIVEAYDVRPAAAEQIRSLGAKSIDLQLDTAGSEDAGGYAKAQGDDEQARQQAALTPFIAAADVVITTAAIPGVRSPLLVTKAMVESMRPGSLIVDLAAERGGNCALTVADEVVDHGGVIILGSTQLESGSARSSSQMFANNLVTLIRHLTDDELNLTIDPDDEITGAMLVTRGGEVVHPRVKAALS
ncbi:MAG: NAD(P)(+) transhydrogenase (Re/Si-specific) subunit alpha [Actinobacteria bacterium]|nr:NAD(P)(+) transhydrogenase (Re/Si-specific) subunit alpha [Actinomycetota bacterium]